ncbi:hypothetical protein GF337_03120 [candidate division KSB1 bacterium]|nr:hypothetical protein [candidate division KSB1 bacterium]
MGLKSVQVPQPEFSNWVIQRRQELNLSPACFRSKVEGKLSERTLKYLEDGKKNSFSEYTLMILAKNLDFNYVDLIEVIEQLNHKPPVLNKIRRSKLLAYFLTAASVLFLMLLLNSNFYNNKDQLADVQIHNQYPYILVAFDGQGNKLWQRNASTRIAKVAKTDLDKDGNIEVLAATGKLQVEDSEKKSGYILFWDEKGHLIVEHNLWKPSIYPAKEPRASVSDFKIIDLEKDGVLEIVVAVHGEQYYPSRIAMLHFRESRFEEVKSYWNPGYVLQLFIEDVNNDSLPEIICSCVNNDFKRVPEFGLYDNVHAIFMLKGTEIYGQAPPYLGNEQIGSEVWYHYVTPPSSDEGSKIVDLRFMGEKEKLIYIKLQDMCFFYLDHSGNMVDTFQGDECEWKTALHRVPKGKIWK